MTHAQASALATPELRREIARATERLGMACCRDYERHGPYAPESVATKTWLKRVQELEAELKKRKEQP